MKKYKCFVVLFILMLVFIVPSKAQNTPKLNDGKKWRILYYEGGPYSEYIDNMRTLVNGLVKLGWITNKNVPQINQDVPLPYIDWLSKNSGTYLTFDPKNSYSGNWDDNENEELKKEIMQKLINKEVDIVIAMGTVAGKALSNNQHSVPVMVLSTTDPISAGIVNSIEDSGFNHVTARVDPSRYLRQLRMFHRIVDFDVLGVVSEGEDSNDYSILDEIRQIAKERNFKIKICDISKLIECKNEYNGACFICFDDLSKHTDAVFVTALLCADTATEKLASIFKKRKIPSFSLVGSKWVKKGILMSISSDSGYKGLSKYNANKFGEILNGTKPRDLNQLFEDPLDIAVNMETARIIGFKMPKGILKIATEVYEE